MDFERSVNSRYGCSFDETSGYRISLRPKPTVESWLPTICLVVEKIDRYSEILKHFYSAFSDAWGELVDHARCEQRDTIWAWCGGSVFRHR